MNYKFVWFLIPLHGPCIGYCIFKDKQMQKKLVKKNRMQTFMSLHQWNLLLVGSIYKLSNLTVIFLLQDT